MKHILTSILIFVACLSFSQEKDKEQLLAMKRAKNYVYEGNSLAETEDFVSAEMEYRKALSENTDIVAGAYNLGNTYYNSGNFEEAIFRLEQAAKMTESRDEKHKAFHNIGNILMKNKKCKEAVEAYKNALRNNPKDDETRYNFAVAKKCAEEQEDQQDQNQDKDNEDQDQNQDDKDQENQDQDNKDKEGEDKEDQQEKEDQGDEDKQDGEDKEDEEGKPKDEKEDEGKGEKEEKKEQPQPKPQQGQLSPQQIKNLLEAMNNQEQEVQEKINAEKQKGVKVKTDKDW